VFYVVVAIGNFFAKCNNFLEKNPSYRIGLDLKNRWSFIFVMLQSINFLYHVWIGSLLSQYCMLRWANQQFHQLSAKKNDFCDKSHIKSYQDLNGVYETCDYFFHCFGHRLSPNLDRVNNTFYLLKSAIVTVGPYFIWNKFKFTSSTRSTQWAKSWMAFLTAILCSLIKSVSVSMTF